MSHLETVLLCHAVSSLNGGAGTVFEFGTFEGITTLNIALHAAKIVTLDCGESKSARMDAKYIRRCDPRDLWSSHGVADKIVQITCDSMDFTPESSLTGVFDAVLVDGNHSIDYVRKDTLNAQIMLKTGGLVVWHDYNKKCFPAVTSFVSEMASDHEVFWLDSHSEYIETSLAFMRK